MIKICFIINLFIKLNYFLNFFTIIGSNTNYDKYVATTTVTAQFILLAEDPAFNLAS